MQPLQNRTKVLFWSLISFAITVAFGGAALTIWDWTKPCPVKSEKRVWGSCYRNLSFKPLIIGVASAPANENYDALVTYLQDKLGIQVEIDRDSPFGENSERIARKDWDIAFTRSPIFSIAAEDNGYVGVATMFPNQPRYYRAALFVRTDSPIRSIADIKSTTTIALGSPESAPTFLMPIYALYGKSLRVGTGYSPQKAVESVKAGKVDIGAGRYTAVKDDPAFRIIYVSKAIPGVGVYLSPLLSSTDSSRVREALLNAPPEIQVKSNYDNSPVPKYDELRKIVARTEEVLACPGLNLSSFNLDKTVNLFCPQQQNSNAIAGQVREYKVLTESSIEFKVVTPKNQVYLVQVDRQILNQVPINPIITVERIVQIKDVKPQKLADETWTVKITRPEQLSIINDSSLE